MAWLALGVEVLADSDMRFEVVDGGQRHLREQPLALFDRQGGPFLGGHETVAVGSPEGVGVDLPSGPGVDVLVFDTAGTSA